MYATEIIIPGPTNFAYLVSTSRVFSAASVKRLLRIGLNSKRPRADTAVPIRRHWNFVDLDGLFLPRFIVVVPSRFDRLNVANIGVYRSVAAVYKTILKAFPALVSLALGFNELLVVSSGSNAGGF